MQIFSLRSLTFNGVFTLLLCFISTGFALAQDVMVLQEGRGELIPRSERIGNVFVADPTLADVSIADDGSIFLFAKEAGETTLIATGIDGEVVLESTVRVIHNVSELREAVGRLYPQAEVAFDTARGQLVARGRVNTDGERAGIIETAEAMISKANIVDQIEVRASNIIRLNVKLYEFQGNSARTAGLNDLSISGGGLSISASPSDSAQVSLQYDGSGTSNPAGLVVALQLLESNGLVSLIENTTIATVIGETAELTVGGQFPVPVGGTLDTSAEEPIRRTGVEYRFFGTKMLFTPESSAGGKVRLTVDSEISNPSNTTTDVDGNNLQNFVTRSVSSKIELEEGQPFLLAGLSRDLSRLNATSPNGGFLGRASQSIFGRGSLSEDSLNLLMILTPVYSEEPVQVDTGVHIASNLEFILDRRGVHLSDDTARMAGFGFEY